MRFLYNLLITLLTPLFFIAFYWLGRNNPAWRQAWGQRAGRLQIAIKPHALWIHAASVGEVMATQPLVNAFQQAYPQTDILISTFTPTGAEQVRKLYAGRVQHHYLPVDNAWFLRRFIRALKPGALVVIERELWPNLLTQCVNHQVPVLLANARMSEKSMRSYQRFPALIKFMLQQISLVAVQNSTDAQRYLALGLAEDKLSITGSMKFDVSVDESVLAYAPVLRQQWGSARPVLALASSHEGEDEQLLQLYSKLIAVVPDLLLMLIPRHPERFEPVCEAALTAGLNVQRRSKGWASASTQIYVADTMGEMLKLLSAADVVLMGGSLIERGGHNPIEPAALGKPVLIGPHYFNFNEIVIQLERAGALELVSVQSEQLYTELSQLLLDKPQQQRMSQAALAAVAANRGAVKDLVNYCAGLMALAVTE